MPKFCENLVPTFCKKNLAIGLPPTVSGAIPGQFLEVYRTIPGHIPAISKTPFQSFPAQFWTCPGNIPEISRKCPGIVPNTSWTFPEHVLEIVLFLDMSWKFIGQILEMSGMFCVVVCVFLSFVNFSMFV